MTRRRRLASSIVALIAIALGLLAGVPVQTRDLGPHPRTTFDYQSAVSAIMRRRDGEARTVVPSGRSVLLAHGQRTPIAVLLLHGYTNSPLQFDSLGRMLYRDGANVYIPRLPHHAERNDGAGPLARMTAEELRAGADSAMDIADALGDTVVVAGLSLGGTMAAWIAQFRPDAGRVVIIAPLMALARVPALLDRPVLNLAVRLPNFTDHSAPNPSEPDRELGWSTHAVGEILRLGLAVRRASAEMPSACRHIAILLNAHDRTISARPVLAMGGRWARHGAVVQIYELPLALGLPHDVIDPRQRVRRLDIVYPVIVALVRGREPGSISSKARQNGYLAADIAIGRTRGTHQPGEPAMALKLSSPAFSPNGEIPKAHTCKGAGTAPPLTWTGVPAGTRTIALIVDDPDAPDPKAPKRTFVHWVAYDIPGTATSLEDGGADHPKFREGVNDARGRGYTGPCPPIGRHRYFFKLYALDTALGDLGEPTKAELERAMKDHVLDHAELIGTYAHDGD